MLLSKKTKGFFIEVNDHSVFVARTTAPVAPLVIEELRSCGVADDKALAEILAELQGKRTGQKSYMHATCGIYSPKRIVRRAALDSKRFKDPGYLNEVLIAQARVEPERSYLRVPSTPPVRAVTNPSLLSRAQAQPITRPNRSFSAPAMIHPVAPTDAAAARSKSRVAARYCSMKSAICLLICKSSWPKN